MGTACLAQTRRANVKRPRGQDRDQARHDPGHLKCERDTSCEDRQKATSDTLPSQIHGRKSQRPSRQSHEASVSYSVTRMQDELRADGVQQRRGERSKRQAARMRPKDCGARVHNHSTSVQARFRLVSQVDRLPPRAASTCFAARCPLDMAPWTVALRPSDCVASPAKKSVESTGTASSVPAPRPPTPA